MTFTSFVAAQKTPNFCEWCGKSHPNSLICPKCGKYCYKKTCPRCDSSYESNIVKDFCPNCGTKFTATSIVCPICNTVNGLKFKFCTGCGKKLKI